MFVAVLDDFDLYLQFNFVDMSVHILMMYLKFDFSFDFVFCCQARISMENQSCEQCSSFGVGK